MEANIIAPVARESAVIAVRVDLSELFPAMNRSWRLRGAHKRYRAQRTGPLSGNGAQLTRRLSLRGRRTKLEAASPSFSLVAGTRSSAMTCRLSIGRAVDCETASPSSWGQLPLQESTLGGQKRNQLRVRPYGRTSPQAKAGQVHIATGFASDAGHSICTICGCVDHSQHANLARGASRERDDC